MAAAVGSAVVPDSAVGAAGPVGAGDAACVSTGAGAGDDVEGAAGAGDADSAGAAEMAVGSGSTALAGTARPGPVSRAIASSSDPNRMQWLGGKGSGFRFIFRSGIMTCPEEQVTRLHKKLNPAGITER